ncbi:molybdopterin cofactor-binding domain-containing protein [Paraburkholderia phymatum]|uniref:Aldehyde oxidase and xanthine dehydrogenase molybdopterin binding n=1 Tax=Paraburkholderia phymatum (strain DSM 17167 / CIP 108236 / LMG 21445 / STM815) TaxID=391038 RepID=B2JPD7_PARP8|nr:molybdopterin cofactor-binding domain-containing protein [Paraburkholderia phymatum]ACC73140.1 aldehyde oxidase and xanthine dehydrogenase molybdopterin binding [Paraburkholderia phymatum STM815]
MLKRRTFLLGGVGVAGALVIGWSALPPRQRLVTSEPMPVRPGEAALNGYVKIAADNTVTVVMCRTEMGQGVHTGLAMLIAEELDANWDDIRVANAPLDDIYNNIESVAGDLPFRPDNDGVVKEAVVWLTRKLARDFGTVMTGGSSSINDLWLPMREAGACARTMLIAAAAGRWDVRAADCRIEKGMVVHDAGHKAAFGQLAMAASRQPLPRKPVLKDPEKFQLIGKPITRIDAASKLNGSAVFGIDVVPDGLLYASIVMCPTHGGTVAHFDASAAAALAGVRKIFAVDAYNGGTGGVAVVAENMFIAMKAIDALTINWNDGPMKGLTVPDIDKRLTQALDESEGHAWYSHGDVDGALKRAAHTLKAEYRAPYLAHAALEPVNCTAQVKDGKATVWAATQVPAVARMHVARVLGIGTEQVDLQQQMPGGAFGRRLEVDFIAQAVAIAREAEGRPVQTLWTRQQDMRHDFYRPACVSRFHAGLDEQGRLIAWHNASVSQSIVAGWLARNYRIPDLGLNFDKTVSEGAFDQPYEMPNVWIGQRTIQLPMPVGFWRSVGHSHQAFFIESFIDELAALARKDPVVFRASMLTKHPRHLAVLQKVASMSGWRMPAVWTAKDVRHARGVALHEAFGSVVGQVAQVSLQKDGTVKVEHVYCAIDCGLPVNPNLIRQQVEGAIVFGLSAAFKEEITLKDGAVVQGLYSEYDVVRMDECPDITVEIMPSKSHPQGVGETAVPPVAPAVANALCALTGTRDYALPLKHKLYVGGATCAS